MGVFPSDAHTIYDAIGSKDKTLKLISGAHYFEDSMAHREKVADLVVDWISAHI